MNMSFWGKNARDAITNINNSIALMDELIANKALTSNVIVGTKMIITIIESAFIFLICAPHFKL